MKTTILQAVLGGSSNISKVEVTKSSSRKEMKKQKSQCHHSARKRRIPAAIDSLLPSTLRFSSFSVSIAKFKLFSYNETLRKCHELYEKPILFRTGKNAAKALQAEAFQAVANGWIPSLASDGCGGVYFIAQPKNVKDSKPFAVFKPRDEEFMAPRNPRGYRKEGAIVGETEHPVQPGFKIGNGAVMERAAYLLDAAYNHFSGVPTTCLTKLKLNGEEREGSIQAYVPFESSAEDMGTLHFDVAQVQKIGLFDIRMFNTDRHAGNILLSERPGSKTFEMTPIDHGFCLPSFMHLESATFDWIRWPQAMFPFHPDTLDHIASIDVERDAQLLRNAGVDEDSLTTFRICSHLLKIGAGLGRSLQAIGMVLVRDGDCSAPSILEFVVAQAMETLAPPSSFKPRRAYGDALVLNIIRVMPSMFARQPKKKVRSVSSVA